MNKIIPVLILAVVLLCSLTACSQTITTTPPVNSPSTVADENLDGASFARLINGKTLATLYRIKSEADFEKTYENAYKKYIPDFKLKGIVYFDSLTDGLLMLRSRKVDALEIPKFTGHYLAQRDTDLKVYTLDRWESTTNMIFSPEKKAQFDSINSSLKAMKEDGTLSKLVDKWITNLPSREEPSGGVMPVIENAETLKVGISGDEPPLDYIAADGAPGGFNVAVLSEISRRTKINIEMVTVNGGARFTAMQSGKIDAFLWHNTTYSVDNQTRTPSATLGIGSYNALMTDSYLEAFGSEVFLK
jgi:hypothetical protein